MCISKRQSTIASLPKQIVQPLQFKNKTISKNIQIEQVSKLIRLHSRSIIYLRNLKIDNDSGILPLSDKGVTENH